MQTTELATREQGLVSQAVKTEDAVKHFEEFQKLKASLLKDEDYQEISGKRFVKKAGWRKLALVFNISDEIMEEKREVREDQSFVWHFKVRATAPNGRSTEAVGSCDSKERNFSKKEHDVKATAHTRAKSRAISDLIGAGEVSAEEMSSEDLEQAQTQKAAPQTAKNVTPPPAAAAPTAKPAGRQRLWKFKGEYDEVTENSGEVYELSLLFDGIVKQVEGISYSFKTNADRIVEGVAWYGLPKDNSIDNLIDEAVKKTLPKTQGVLA